MSITTRSAKGAELTHAEMDTNFTDLRDGVNIQIPKTKGLGLKVDSLGTPGFPWQDIIGQLNIDENDVNAPKYAVYRGTVKARQFVATTTDVQLNLHLPHDYAPGTAIHVHVHWSHNSALVTGGSVTWGFETTYSKGHNQGAFIAPIVIAIIDPASTIQYQHLIAETVASSIGGSATTFDTNMIEADGVIQGRVYLDSNDLTVSSGGIPAPFIHFVDMHYQSTGIGTKQKTPDFWT